MYHEGYEDITNIDISFTVIQQMTELFGERCPKMVYKQMDVRDMSEFGECTFDAVIDKGTFDSILCGFDSRPNSLAMLSEVNRVLKPQGVYICITYGTPAQRKKLTESDLGWKISSHQVTKSYLNPAQVVAANEKNENTFHYIFVLRRLNEAKPPPTPPPKEEGEEEEEEEEKE